MIIVTGLVLLTVDFLNCNFFKQITLCLKLFKSKKIKKFALKQFN